MSGRSTLTGYAYAQSPLSFSPRIVSKIMTTLLNSKPLTSAEMAKRLARDIPDGWAVNLGIGLPTVVADHVPADREVLFQSENGILGMGPAPAKDAIDPWLVNAGKQHITLSPGAALFHHADSFAMIRGQHLDLCVLGAYQVAENGDLANWTVPEGDVIPGIGGAMDLAAGAKQIWIMMDHTTKSGEPKLVKRCTYPLTAPACVTRVYTNIAVLDVTPQGFALVECFGGFSAADVQERTGVTISNVA
jgi:3-oxoadipate CoA-transferase, beta subunit